MHGVGLQEADSGTLILKMAHRKFLEVSRAPSPHLGSYFINRVPAFRDYETAYLGKTFFAHELAGSGGVIGWYLNGNPTVAEILKVDAGCYGPCGDPLKTHAGALQSNRARTVGRNRV